MKTTEQELKTLKEKLPKGICPKCGNDLDFIEEYLLIKCPKCGYQIPKREMDAIINKK